MQVSSSFSALRTAIMENVAVITTASPKPLDRVTRFLHLGLAGAGAGAGAWLVGSGWIGAGAADYEHPDHFWYI